MSYLIHYNHNHDALGRFARSNSSSGLSNRTKRKIDKDLSRPYLLKQNPNPLSRSRTIRYSTNIKPTKKIKTKTNRSELRNKWQDELAKKEIDSKERRDFHLADKAMLDRGRYLEKRWNRENPNKYKDKFGEDYDNYKKDIVRYKNNDKKYVELRQKFIQADDNRYIANKNRGRKYAQDHIDQFVDATIKDLKLQNTEEVRSYIKEKYDVDWVDKSYTVLNSKSERKMRKESK